jgi:hypothetical protein
MSWKKERDTLVSQTLAFVQSVAGKKGDTREGVDRADWGPEIEAARLDAFKLAELPVIAEPSGSPEPSKKNQISPLSAAIDFRIEIQNRVANFRAHQQRFQRERAEYFNTTIARARATIDDDFAPRAEKTISGR